MDLDLDFSNDEIESFLNTKLEEIRLKNESLEIVLNEHKLTLKSEKENSCMKNVNFKVKQDEHWKHIFSNKYALGYVIESKNCCKDVQIFLTWNSEEALSYKAEIFGVISTTKDCKEAKNCSLVSNTVEKPCNVFKGRAYLVVVIDIPQYLSQLEYEIIGTFICKVEGQELSSPLPKIKINVNDCPESLNWIDKNYLRNILLIMACTSKADLVIILPEEWRLSLISTFEIHCALKHIKMEICCKSYFVANDSSKFFNNSLIVVHPDHENKNILFLNIHAANNDQICAFCHHLGSCLPNIVFFPLTYYESYLCKKAVFSHELLEEFGSSMRQELQNTYKFIQNYSNDNLYPQFNQFRSDLSLIESNTDKYFLKVTNMKY